MAMVPQRDLRNKVGEVLRRAEAGERLTITVDGRPVAELGPTRTPRVLASADDLARLFDAPVDPAWLDELAEDRARDRVAAPDPWR